MDKDGYDDNPQPRSPEPQIPRGGPPLQAVKVPAHPPNLVRLYWRLFRDPRVGLPAKAVLIAGLAYLLIPTDLLVDLGLPVIGFVDDAAVMALALKGFIWLAPRQVVEEHVRLIDRGA